ncbi:MAG: hypothetical protein ABIS59_01860 [Candidatus Saccharibacteria bacterium]
MAHTIFFLAYIGVEISGSHSTYLMYASFAILNFALIYIQA